MMFYPEAWLSSPQVAGMEPAGRAGYFDILCSMWLAGGSLPDDDDALRAYSRLERKEWARLGPKIRACLSFDSGEVSQSRLAEEYERTIRLQADRSKAGKDGADRRWRKHGKPDGKPDGKPMAKPWQEHGKPDGKPDGKPMQTETETKNGNQQQQISEHRSAAADPEPISSQVLDAVRHVFPTAKGGERWERELAAVRPAQWPDVAGLIRSDPAKKAETPVILVREAVAAVRRGWTRGEDRKASPAVAEILATLEGLGRAAAGGDNASVLLLCEYRDGLEYPPEVRAAAAGELARLLPGAE